MLSKVHFFVNGWIESADILTEILLPKLQGRKRKRVGKLCYHMLSEMEKQFVLGIIYVEDEVICLLLQATNRFCYIKKEMKKRIWERSVLSNIWQVLL